MIAFLVLSAGIAYFVSLPFASLLQGANYNLSTFARRAKRWIVLCAVSFLPFAAFAVTIRCFCRETIAFLLSLVLYATMGGFTIFLHKKMRLKMTYTDRLVRLLITATFLYVALFLPLRFFGWSILWTVLPALSPLSLSLAAMIIAPFEKGNNARYLKKAKKVLDESNAIKIGITGSYGKTSVKNALEQLLSVKYETLASPANYNTPLGVAKTLEQRTGKEEVLILEMGARRRGDIRELCELVNPGIGVITGIAPQHLETFGSFDAILEEKGVIGEAVPTNGTVYYNLTDEKVRTLYDRRVGGKVGIGFEKAEWIIGDLLVREGGTSFSLSQGGVKEVFTIPLFGTAAVVDFAIACAVAIDIGVTAEAIRERARRLAPAPHRFEVMKKGKVVVIDDSYNVNPVGAASALRSLDLFKGKRKIVYTSGIVELGKETEVWNRMLGAQIAERCDLAIVGGGKYGDYVEQGIMLKNPLAAVMRVRDTEEASAAFRHLLKEGDVLLIMSDLPRDYLV